MTPEGRKIAEALVMGTDNQFTYTHDALFRVQIDSLSELLVPIVNGLAKSALDETIARAKERQRLERQAVLTDIGADGWPRSLGLS